MSSVKILKMKLKLQSIKINLYYQMDYISSMKRRLASVGTSFTVFIRITFLKIGIK